MEGRLRVGLLFGGSSVEHEVSVVSARGIFAGFDTSRFEVLPIGVTPVGRWLTPEVSLVILNGGGGRVEPDGSVEEGAHLVADPAGGGLLRLSASGATEPFELDAVFPIIHGWGGEDGRIQGLLELAGLPCVGAGVAGSAVAMDKGLARAVVGREGLALAPWEVVARQAYRENPEAVRRRLEESPGFPLFVKPANGGSSVGIRKVSRPAGLPEALEKAFSLDRRVVVEKALDAREVECAVLGNEDPRASVPGEVVPAAEFYTYEDKYLDGSAELLIPAPLGEEVAETVRTAAVRAFRCLDLSGMARIDFLVERRTGEVFFNEANTLPGFTPISMYSKLWEASGLPYPDLLARLVDLAIERREGERRRATHWKI